MSPSVLLRLEIQPWTVWRHGGHEVIGAFTMATKGSSADPSHTPRKLKGRGGKIDHSTGVADGLIVAFFAHRLALRFTTGIVTSRYLILAVAWAGQPSVRGPMYQVHETSAVVTFSAVRD